MEAAALRDEAARSIDLAPERTADVAIGRGNEEKDQKLRLREEERMVNSDYDFTGNDDKPYETVKACLDQTLKCFCYKHFWAKGRPYKLPLLGQMPYKLVCFEKFMQMPKIFFSFMSSSRKKIWIVKFFLKKLILGRIYNKTLNDRKILLIFGFCLMYFIVFVNPYSENYNKKFKTKNRLKLYN